MKRLAMARRMRRQERGQAVVELALGSLVLVTILVVGIHFAEFGFLWVKVEEAANFALFDETNRKMHTTPGTWDVFASDLGNKGTLNTDVLARYQDFDGLSSVTNGATVTQVFTQGTGLTVTCDAYKGPTIDVANAGSTVGMTLAQTTYGAADKANAGESCQVTASLAEFRMAKKFFTKDTGGTFDAEMTDGKGASGTVCAAGRGSCGSQGFRMVLDDWGYQGQQEGENCPITDTGCTNTGYYQMANATYGAAGGSNGSHGSDLAKLVTGGTSPTDESPFWMSFQGENSTNSSTPFNESHDAEEDHEWPTTPYDHPPAYKSAYDGNGKCFLGSKC